MNYFEALPASIFQSLQELKNLLSSHTKRAYLVGGCVRDILRGIEPKDVDIEVYDIEPKIFAKLMEGIGAKGVGKTFFVYKWNELDIALAREENKTASGHQGFEVRVCQDEKVASSRRDFTCNALMVGLNDGKLYDFWGGVGDINASLLRHIDSEKFSEDPLRVLRGVQFCSRFGFRIADETLELMKSLDLRELSQTRITWELEKLFVGSFYAHGIFALCQLNLFEKLLHVKISPSQGRSLARRLHKYRKNLPEPLQPYYWLFFFLAITKAEPKAILSSLGLGRGYERMLVNVPFGNPNISDYELLKIAIDRPLNSWVGVCYPGVLNRAKELDIFEKNFDGNVDVQRVIRDGFCGKDISKELRRRILHVVKEKSNSQE